MNIVENEKIKMIKQELLNNIRQEISFFENRLLEQEKKVVYWKYANDEFYTLIPFYHELDKLKTGRILKNIQFERRFDQLNIFSFAISSKCTVDAPSIVLFPEITYFLIVSAL